MIKINELTKVESDDEYPYFVFACPICGQANEEEIIVGGSGVPTIHCHTCGNDIEVDTVARSN